VRRTAPDLFLSRNSILSVFAAETRDGYGADLDWRPVRLLRLQADSTTCASAPRAAPGRPLPRTGRATRPRCGRASSSSPPIPPACRAAGWRSPATATSRGASSCGGPSPARWGLSVDADLYRFKEPIRGRTHSYTGAASLTWQLAPQWAAALTGIASVTPYFESRFEGLARLVYNFSTRTREVVP
jgi:hypothetical protein